MTMKINKYKVSQELMNDINEWRDSVHGLVIKPDLGFIRQSSIHDWWLDSYEYNSEKNNRLMALIQYVNGEDVFEVEKPKKWVVQSKDIYTSNLYQFITLYDLKNSRLSGESVLLADVRDFALVNSVNRATKFDSKEEAEKWANPLMEVVEVDG